MFWSGLWLDSISFWAAAIVLNPAEATTIGDGETTSQAAGESNDCANGTEPTNTVCDNSASQIQGDDNIVIQVTDVEQDSDNDDGATAQDEEESEEEDAEFE